MPRLKNRYRELETQASQVRSCFGYENLDQLVRLKEEECIENSVVQELELQVVVRVLESFVSRA